MSNDGFSFQKKSQMMDNELAIVEEQKQTKALPQGVRAVGQRQSPHSCGAWSSLRANHVFY
jgi:hypothetical protein